MRSDLTELYKRASKIYGPSFAAWMSVHLLEGKGAHSTIHQLYIDYLRMHNGKKGLKRVINTKKNDVPTDGTPEETALDAFIASLLREFPTLHALYSGASTRDLEALTGLSSFGVFYRLRIERRRFRVKYKKELKELLCERY